MIAAVLNVAANDRRVTMKARFGVGLMGAAMLFALLFSSPHRRS